MIDDAIVLYIQVNKLLKQRLSRFLLQNSLCLINLKSVKVRFHFLAFMSVFNTK
jgi:hypothetical protein